MYQDTLPFFNRNRKVLMSKIRILPEQLANQIAAGEVVERPASVVKELVENSLDAGATRIEVEIEGGGTQCIRVIDDGEGMDEDDLLLSLERHGTSKITKEEDLGAIVTLGFRGEAMPSIGSVSRLVLTSRPKGQELGTRVQMEYGRLTRVHETGCSFGTTIEVKGLFGNTPARRKFLRTTRTEMGHIEEIVKNYALGSPGTAFILRINGKDSLYLDKTQSIKKRLATIMNYKGEFIPVSSTQEKPLPRKLSGFLVPPEQVTAGPARLRIFVNGRAVRDRMVIHAVTEGLRGFLMKGKNPSGLVHLAIGPDEIDVNVHPAKHEIRFRNSRDVHTFIHQGVASAIHAHQSHLQASIFNSNQQNPRTRIPTENSWQPYSQSSIDNEQKEDHPQPASLSGDSDKASTASPPPPLPAQPLLETAEPINTGHSQEEMEAEELLQEHAFPEALSADQKPVPAPQTQESPPAPPSRKKHNLLVIGQFADLYIFCQSSEGLVVIDQHAAHERLLYEKFRRQYMEGRIARQTLMFPEQVELTLFQARLVEKNMEELNRIGFSIRDFGGNTFIISAVPALAGTTSGRELFLDILEQFGSENDKKRGGDYLDNILATMACKAAVKAGTALCGTEINKLLDDMAKADLFSHCPHGRPVVKQFSGDEVKKWFYRT